MTQTGTPYYASPEVWRDMPYDVRRSQLPAGASCPPRMSIWNDEMGQPFLAFFERVFNNFSGSLKWSCIRPKATCGHWGASSMLLGSFKPLQIASEIVRLDIGFQVKEMVALRPPFRAEDMEGLYRILNTIRLRIVLDGTSLFPTFVWTICCWPLILCPELLVDRQSGPWPIPSHPCTL